MERGDSLGQLLLSVDLALGISLDLVGLSGEGSHGIGQACGVGAWCDGVRHRKDSAGGKNAGVVLNYTSMHACSQALRDCFAQS
jgi:hypothetical protein